MDNDQYEIEQQLQPFQEACRREGFDVQFLLIPMPWDTEALKNWPISFHLKVIEPGIRERHYIDTWILFRRLLRETVDWPIRKRFFRFHIYPTLEASYLPLPPVPHQETTELFNRLLYIFYRAFIEMRVLSGNKDGTTMPMIYEICEALHELPHTMLCCGYGSEDDAAKALEITYSFLERYEEQRQQWMKAGKPARGNFLHILEMPYEQFLNERLYNSNGRQTAIVFDPDRKQMMRS